MKQEAGGFWGLGSGCGSILDSLPAGLGVVDRRSRPTQSRLQKSYAQATAFFAVPINLPAIKQTQHDESDGADKRAEGNRTQGLDRQSWPKLRNLQGKIRGENNRVNEACDREPGKQKHQICGAAHAPLIASRLAHPFLQSLALARVGIAYDSRDKLRFALVLAHDGVFNAGIFAYSIASVPARTRLDSTRHWKQCSASMLPHYEYLIFS